MLIAPSPLNIRPRRNERRLKAKRKEKFCTTANRNKAEQRITSAASRTAYLKSRRLMNPFLISTVWAHDSRVLETSKAGMRFQNRTKSKWFVSAENIFLFCGLNLNFPPPDTHAQLSLKSQDKQWGWSCTPSYSMIVGDYNRRRAGPDAYYHVGFVRDVARPADSENFLQCVVDGSSRPFVLLCLCREQPAGWINY